MPDTAVAKKHSDRSSMPRKKSKPKSQKQDQRELDEYAILAARVKAISTGLIDNPANEQKLQLAEAELAFHNGFAERAKQLPKKTTEAQRIGAATLVRAVDTLRKLIERRKQQHAARKAGKDTAPDLLAIHSVTACATNVESRPPTEICLDEQDSTGTSRTNNLILYSRLMGDASAAALAAIAGLRVEHKLHTMFADKVIASILGVVGTPFGWVGTEAAKAAGEIAKKTAGAVKTAAGFTQQKDAAGTSAIDLVKAALLFWSRDAQKRAGGLDDEELAAAIKANQNTAVGMEKAVRTLVAQWKSEVFSIGSKAMQRDTTLAEKGNSIASFALGALLSPTGMGTVPDQLLTRHAVWIKQKKGPPRMAVVDTQPLSRAFVSWVAPERQAAAEAAEKAHFGTAPDVVDASDIVGSEWLN